MAKKKQDAKTQPQYPSHGKQLPRLNRIAGQVEGIKKMIENGRYCPDILLQIKAIRSALYNLEVEILDSHLSHCVNDAFLSENEREKQIKIDEIREMIKRFNK